jgi:hypothetical protein
VSFWNRLGQLAKDFEHGTADVAGAFGAPVKFVWDVATSPFNDDAQFNGIKNTLVNSGAHAISHIAKPFGDIGNAPIIKPVLNELNAVNESYIRHPLSTLALEGSIAKTDADLLKPETWKKSWDVSRNVSAGQSLVGLLGSFKSQVTGTNADVTNEVNWEDPQSVHNYFNHGSQKIWSGIGDAAIQTFGDVSIAGGKVAKAARYASWATNTFEGGDVANKLAKTINNVSKVEDLSSATSKESKWLDTVVKSDAVTLRNHPVLKDAPDSLVYAMGQATDRKTAGVLTRVGMGDPNALSDLKVLRPDLANPIARSQGALDAHGEYILSRDSSLTDRLTFPWEHPAVIDEVNNEVNSLLQHDKEFANMWAVKQLAETPGGSLTRLVGAKPIQSLENAIAVGRTPVTTKFDIHQPTAFHRMYQIVSWPAGERPSGHINLNDPESSREVSAQLDRAVKVKAIDPESARNLMEGYIGAATPELRQQQVYNIENAVFGRIASKYGMDTETASKVYANYRRARATALATMEEHGYAIDTDGSIIRIPQMESQTANTLPMMDFDNVRQALRQHNLRAKQGFVGSTASHIYDAGNATIDGLDTLQSLFKVGALARIGFPIRNTLEAQLRIMASVGSIASLRHLGEGLNNIVYNKIANPSFRVVDRMWNAGGKMNYVDHKNEFAKLGAQIKGVKDQLKEVENQISQDPNNLDAVAHKQVLDNILFEKEGFQAFHSKRMTDLENQLTSKKRMASGTYNYTGLDGTKYTLDQAFGGPFGDIHWGNSSSENTYMNFTDTNARLLSKQMVSKGNSKIMPSEPNYWTEWSRVMNHQFGNSMAAKKLAGGDSVAKVIKWMTTDPEGRNLRIRLGIEPTGIDEHVNQVKSILDNYLPDSKLQNSLAKGEQITPEMLRKTFSDPASQPVIHGNLIEENLNLLGQKKIDSFVNGVFKLIGSMPEDAFSRHPLYADLYKRSLENRIDTFTKLNGRAVNQEELRSAYSAAHNDAVRGLRQTLFTIERKSNLASFMRFVSPFFTAWENSAKTWAKLAFDKPQIVNRANLIFTAPNRAGIATDANGNPVPADKASMNDYIWLNVPNGLKHLPFIGKGLESLDQMGIQKKSLDVVFQGDAQVPVGPYVSMPVSAIVKNQPSYEQSLKWAIPFGPDRKAFYGLLPGWAKRQLVESSGQSDPQYANSYALIYQTEMHKSRENGTLPKTPAQLEQFEKHIKDLTNSYWNMRTVANLVLPFAPTFKSPYKYYIDKYNQYQVTYGKDAQAQFWKDYGDDFFDFTMSLSKNNTGIGSTVTDVQNAQKYSDLVSQISKVNPQMVGIVTSAGRGTYQFSQAAYQWELSNKVSPSGDLTFRGTNDPAEAIKQNKIQLGWIKYRNVMNQVDAVMQSRGLTSLNQSGAGDLKALKKQAVADLAKQNHDWALDYMDPNGAKGAQVRDVFKTILNDPKFMADHGQDTTWKSVRLYLEVQDQVEKVLANRKVKGIDAKYNADLKFALDTAANKLKHDDIGFGDLYDRYLSYDPVYNPLISGSGQ